jgi:PAS domain S-box-containing protein
VRAIHDERDGIVVVDRNGFVVSLNQCFLEVWQIPAECVDVDQAHTHRRFREQPIFAIASERVKQPEKFWKRVGELYGSFSPPDHCEIELKDGRTLEHHSIALRDDNGQHLGRAWFFRDITGRKLAESALRDAYQETKAFLNTIPSLLIGLDTAGNIVRWNAGAERIFGLSETDVRGRSLGRCGIAWEGTDIDAILISYIKANQVGKVDCLKFLKAGDPRFVAITLLPVEEHAGRSKAGALVFGADVTDRKILEAELVRAHKMEAVGQLAAGIAHEINTPIQYASDNLLFLKRSWSALTSLIAMCRDIRDKLPSQTITSEMLAQFDRACAEADLEYGLVEGSHAIEQSLDGLQRVAMIVRTIREFSRPGSDNMGPTDLNRAIETTAAVAGNKWSSVAELETFLDRDLPPVPCVAGEFNQIILNMIVNAAEAIGAVVREGAPKGRIRIATRAFKDWAEIRVEDNGIGIPEGIRNRIFEPFFTTKEVGRGSGQGLSLAHALIEKRLGGEIRLESKIGEGTTFVIRLPIAPSGSGNR